MSILGLTSWEIAVIVVCCVKNGCAKNSYLLKKKKEWDVFQTLIFARTSYAVLWAHSQINVKWHRVEKRSDLFIKLEVFCCASSFAAHSEISSISQEIDPSTLFIFIKTPKTCENGEMCDFLCIFASSASLLHTFFFFLRVLLKGHNSGCVKENFMFDKKKSFSLLIFLSPSLTSFCTTCATHSCHKTTALPHEKSLR